MIIDTKENTEKDGINEEVVNPKPIMLPMPNLCAFVVMPVMSAVKAAFDNMIIGATAPRA